MWLIMMVMVRKAWLMGSSNGVMCPGERWYGCCLATSESTCVTTELSCSFLLFIPLLLTNSKNSFSKVTKVSGINGGCTNVSCPENSPTHVSNLHFPDSPPFPFLVSHPPPPESERTDGRTLGQSSDNQTKRGSTYILLIKYGALPSRPGAPLLSLILVARLARRGIGWQSNQSSRLVSNVSRCGSKFCFLADLSFFCLLCSFIFYC